MPRGRRTASEPAQTRHRVATTPEAREAQMISLAERLAEEQLRDGTASAQVISHYLKLGSTREQLEQARLREEVEVLKGKQEQMRSQARIEELYTEAITAMRAYNGTAPLASEEIEDDGYED